MIHDKNNQWNGRIQATPGLHRLLVAMPQEQEAFGLWIIQGGLGGISPVNSFQTEARRRYEFYCISHLIAGHGRFRLGEECFGMSPGDAVLLCPGDEHFYGGAEDDFYQEDTVCFCGRIPDLMRSSGLLHSGLFHLGAQRPLERLVHEAASPERRAWLGANIGLLELLREFFLAQEMPEDALGSLLDKVRNAPPAHWWSVSEMAELRGLSTAQFRREFLARTGMLPKHYIEQTKLRQAAADVANTLHPLALIAKRFGYHDAFHFSRRFKAIIGLPPTEYRKLFGRKG